MGDNVEGARPCLLRLTHWPGLHVACYLYRCLLTVLVDKHSYGDAAGVETVQEILDVVVGDGVLLGEGVLVLDHPLSHGGDHLVVAVPDGFQDLHKPERRGSER